MSVDSKEIDLVINAAIRGQNNLASITKSIADFEKAVLSQTEAAKRGEISLAELTATTLALKNAQDQLKNRADLVGRFQKLSEQIANANKNAEKAAKTQTDFAAKITATGKATETQAERLTKYAAATERAQQAVVKQTSQHSALQEVLQQSGIDVNNLSNAELTLRSSSAQLGLAMDKNQKTIATFSENLKEANIEKKKFADTQAFEKQAAESLKLVRAAEYVDFWSVALNEAEQSQKEFATNVSLRKAADEAVAAARGYTTLGRAISTIATPGPTLANSIKAIIDPAKNARVTLAGVENEFKLLSATITDSAKPVENYAAKLLALSNIQKSIQGKAVAIDNFQSQVVGLRAARTEFSSARKEVLEYAQALRVSKGDNNELIASLDRAKNRLNQASTGLKDQIVATRGLRDGLKQAGIATNDLAGSHARLTTLAKGSLSAVSNLTANFKAYGEATRKAAVGSSFFNTSGRTTLSLFQRFKGEILAATSAYVGFYGVIGNGNKILDAYKSRQEIIGKLTLASGGDAVAAGEDYQYAQDQAERLGIKFKTFADGYSSFLAGASLSGLSKNSSRVIFESFTEFGKTLNISEEKQDKVFLALGQIVSKGQIYSEELKGQLGDALPGLVGIGARALNVTTEQFEKDLKDGKFKLAELQLIAEEVRKIAAPQLAASLQNLTSEQGRLTSAVEKFQLQVADSGFADAFKEFVTKFTNFLKSEDGTKFAINVGKAFTTLSNAFLFALENIDSIILVGKILLGIYASKMFFGAVVSAVDFSKSLLNINGSMTLLNKSFILLTIAIQTFIIAQDFFASNNTFAGFLFTLIAVFRKFYAYVTTGSKIAFLALGDTISDVFSKLISKSAGFLSTVSSLFSKAAKSVGANELAQALTDTAKGYAAIQAVFAKGANTKSTQASKKQLSNELNSIDDETVFAIGEINKRGQSTAGVKKDIKGTVADGKGTGKSTGKNKDKGNLSDAELSKRANRIESLIDQINGSLNTLDDSIDKKVAVTLTERLQAIKDNYTNLVNKIAELAKTNPTQAKTFSDRLEADNNKLILQETKKFYAELAAEKEALEVTIESIEAQAGKKEKQSLDARLAAIDKAQADKFREIETFRLSLIAREQDTKPADELKVRLTGATDKLKDAEREQFFLDGIASRESAINDLLKERSARIETLNIQQKAGLLTTEQVRQGSVAIVEELQPKIQALATEALTFAENIDKGFRPEAVSEFITGINGAVESAKELNLELFNVANVSQMLADGAANALDISAKSFGEAVVGAKSLSEAIKETGKAFLNYAADFLRQIALMIIKRQLLNALEKLGGSGSSGFLGTVIGVLNGGVAHDGGLVGGTMPRSRKVDPSMFIAAPRYHNGGIAGLSPDEYPTILQKNEEVLKKSDPRNVLNGGLNQGAKQAAPQDIKVINMIDSGSVMSEGLASKEGTKAIYNFMRANRSSVKAALG